ncbi:MAG: primosomal protein N' [Bacteroidetes bacterium]|nr:primosomal protein N' [Bacteroidota bacterium]MDA0903153.1 primosomal protein N' [Bacteroidota bacterium]MDA1242400.1 primosomal protein N' [Bacteroidota bacterium]
MKSHRPTFVEVVVPLALPKTLTYAWSLGATEGPVVGTRVVVPLGNKRLTGIVWDVHHRSPEGHVAKVVEAVVDERPVLASTQRDLLGWMAQHYMCTLGEVLGAALPAGMKLESTTRIMLHPDAEAAGELDDQASLLMDALHVRDGLTLRECAEILEIQHPQRVIRGLIQRGLVIAEEELEERLKPRKVAWLTLANGLEEEVLAESLTWAGNRAVAMERLLLTVLDADNHEVPKLEAQKRSQTDASTVQKWVDRGILVIEERDPTRPSRPGTASLPSLSHAQAKAYNGIHASLVARKPALLHGVTGSGKTEIYTHLIAEALSAGQQVLFLVPEIALTTQLIERLRRFFGEVVHVYHSRFSDRERTETWMQLLAPSRLDASMSSGQTSRTDGGDRAGAYDFQGQLIVGARSALLLPMPRLGLIVVDEEHESSFKQHDPAPRYHARDAALWLSAQHGIPLVLGSATPSVETQWLASQGRITLVSLKERFGGAMMPEIFIADLRKEHKQRSMRGGFSKMLRDEMEATFQEGRQVILFQNRRGYAPAQQCTQCGHAVACQRCDIPLVVHKSLGGLHCHHCGYHERPAPSTCVACGSKALKPQGLGTERIEEELAELFPEARVARMDLDSTRKKTAHARLLEAFADREFDVLVGTQMVTKGLDFAHVGLVGVMSADRMLTFPDFRSFERAYQMLTQVAGRAGRASKEEGGKRGRVVIQSFSADHWLLHHVVDHDHDALVLRELIERETYQYPPFVRMVRLTIKHSDAQRVEAGAAVLAARLNQRFGPRLLGPDTPALSRINDLHIRQLTLKFERALAPAQYRPLLQADLDEFSADPRWKRLRLIVDVDPV